MGLSSTLTSLLLFVGLCGICSGFVQANCTNKKIFYDRIYSIPGKVAMLDSNLVDVTGVPSNITWYDSKTGQEMSNQTGRILVLGKTLWFLNTTQDYNSKYVIILSTPSRCYRQAFTLTVEAPVAGECRMPRNITQSLNKGINDQLSCPMSDYIKKLDSYNITSSLKWYKGCDLIEDETGGYTYIKEDLRIEGVNSKNNGSYTCTLTFTLGGITGSTSETIEARVKGDYSWVPQVREPANDTIKEQIGSNFSKRCQIFVPGFAKPEIDIHWLVGGEFVSNTPSDRVYTPKKRRVTGPEEGASFERLLIISELREEDFHINYTCRVCSDRKCVFGYFTLLPADPNLIVPVGLVLGGVMIFFIISVIVYYVFKVDIVLWFRSAFPVLYANNDLDGKLYDAYVAYPQPCDIGFSEEVEAFALNTLPQVLEKSCGYRLFIAGRDSLPGKAIVDSVEDNLQASHRVLLLYTASTFISKRHTSSTTSNNNNNLKSSDCSENSESKTTDNNGMSYDGGEEVYTDTRQQLECVAAMHRALLEGSLKVILVELEEISPAQLALFPESVRQLRKKQGAVCWWKNLRKRQRSGTCMRRSEDEEKGGQDTKLSPSISPSSRFWKEMRYHMPVRGKREKESGREGTLPC
uniref:interleukin-1 receptor type 1-like n=1 Tax=Semicossyphus pulcher TaxID=241346 RepID=UPI0037E73522